MIKNKYIGVAILLIIAFGGLFYSLHSTEIIGHRMPQPPEELLKIPMRVINVDSLEIVEITVGEWERVFASEIETGYRLDKEGNRYSVQQLCRSCDDNIPSLPVPPGMTLPEYRKALAAYDCPKCGENVLGHLTVIDVDTLESLDVRWIDWTRHFNRDPSTGYRIDDEGRNLSGIRFCRSCQERIPIFAIPRNMTSAEYEEALANYHCPRCGEHVMGFMTVIAVDTMEKREVAVIDWRRKYKDDPETGYKIDDDGESYAPPVTCVSCGEQIPPMAESADMRWRQIEALMGRHKCPKCGKHAY